MTYYHATKNILSIGREVRSTRCNTFYPKASKVMDESNEINAFKRETALFYADNAEFAVYYLMKQGVEHSEINLYEIESEYGHKAPFVLTNQVDKRLKNNQCVGNLISEYWNPKLNWAFYEYLTQSFIVKKQVCLPFVDQSFVATMYSCDFLKAEKIS
jgi:hypothetical protein